MVGNISEPTTLVGTTLPPGAKIVRVVEQHKQGEQDGPNNKQWRCEVKMPWSENEFFNKAINTPHPMAAEPTIPDRTKKAIINILTQSIAEWTEKQTRELQRAKEPWR